MTIINNINNYYRREALNVDEMALERECNMFEKRIDNIESEEMAIRVESEESIIKPAPPKVPTTNFNKISEAVPPEVVALQV